MMERIDLDDKPQPDIVILFWSTRTSNVIASGAKQSKLVRWIASLLRASQ